MENKAYIGSGVKYNTEIQEVFTKIKQHDPDFTVEEDCYLEDDRVVFVGDVGRVVKECMGGKDD